MTGDLLATVIRTAAIVEKLNAVILDPLNAEEALPRQQDRAAERAARKFLLTVFPNLKALTKHEYRLGSVAELVQFIRQHEAPTKPRLPLVSLCLYGNLRTDKNSLRHAANVLEIYGIEGDYDGGLIGLKEVAKRLRAAGVECVIHSTPTYTPDKPRWRILCFTSVPLPLGERAKLVSRLNGAVGGILHPESWILSQSFYLGRALDNPHDLEIIYIAGRPIDLCTELDAAAAGPTGRADVAEPSSGDNTDDDMGDGLTGSSRLANISDERLREMLMAIPNDRAFSARTDWRDIGFAVQHQTGGSEVGKAMFFEWSEEQPQKPGALEKFWTSAGKSDDKRQVITARLIVKLYNEVKAKEFEDIKDRLSKAADLKAFETVCKDCKKLDLKSLDSTLFVGLVQDAYRRITGRSLLIVDARKMIRPDHVATPDWLANWVYLAHLERFFHLVTKQKLTARAFDGVHGRFVGDDMSASNFALHRVKIPTYHVDMYAPTEGHTFTFKGLQVVNLYSDMEVPAVPDPLTAQDHANVEVINAHLRNLFGKERDVEILISWLAYIVQTRKRSNFAIVIQGTEGDGKTTVIEMLEAALGSSNVRRLSASVVRGSDFTSWVTGQLVTAIEEFKGGGPMLDKMKEYVTNKTVGVHPKNVNPYDAPNTVNYVLLTNHADALKLTTNDSRYFILMSQIQTKDDLDKFKDRHPGYFKSLYAAIEQSPGAIRQWLLNYQLHPEFDPMDRAPQSQGRSRMIEQARSDEAQILSDALAEGKNPLISSEFLFTDEFIKLVAAEMDGVILSGQTQKTILQEEGFQRVGRVRFKDGLHQVWSKTAAKFLLRTGKCDPEAVKRYYETVMRKRTVVRDDDKPL